ncbi:MAG: amidohydrolase family protein [Bacteroidota bacterium]|jgi:imidazolonepropionase-like amidohydrolase
MTKYIYTLILFFVATFNYAQQIPVVIKGATIHIGNGRIINNGYVAFDSGKIVFVDSVMRNSYKNARIIDATGKHVYPGIVLLNTYLGLNEIDAVRATRDYAETGEINPNVRSLIALNTDSKVTPTAKINGVTYMQVVPQGGLISGTSCVVKTEAWNWEDAAVAAADGIHLNWPELNYFSEHIEEQQKHIEENLKKMTQFFNEAAQYNQLIKPESINLRYAAMKDVFSGKSRLYFHANNIKSIHQIIAFIKANKIANPVLVSSGELATVADELKQQRIPVVLDIVHRLPAYNHSDIDQPYKTAYQLMSKGVKVALGYTGSWESRNVMFHAGTCAAYGLSKEQALQLITQNAAEICGLDTRIGSIESGKMASIIITEGDILDMKSSKVEQLFIEGVEVSTTNHQTELYKKFSDKHGIEAP